MRKTVLVCVVVSVLLAVVGAQSSMCEGIWKIDKVEKCENHEQYPISWELVKRKLDRKTDAFSIDMEFSEDFDAEYGLRMESYEKCDGGYKASDVVVGGVCEMLNKFAKKNFEDILARAGIDPKDCPIKKGKYGVKDYVVDYESLPNQGKCAEIKWDVYTTKRGVDTSCLRAYSTFTSTEGDYEEDDCE